MVLLLMKIIFDSASRIIFFSCIIYVFHDGQFSSLWSSCAFYFMVILQIAVNVVFNKQKPSLSPTYLIGKRLFGDLEKYRKSKISISGIMLNSHSSVLSFNDFDFETVMKTVAYNREKFSTEREYWHQPTILKQLVYYLLNTLVFVG